MKAYLEVAQDLCRNHEIKEIYGKRKVIFFVFFFLL